MRIRVADQQFLAGTKVQLRNVGRQWNTPRFGNAIFYGLFLFALVVRCDLNVPLDFRIQTDQLSPVHSDGTVGTQYVCDRLDPRRAVG